MDATIITGQKGKVTFGTGTPVEIKITKWSLKKSANPINTSDNGSEGFEDFAPAKLVNWTGSFSGFMRKGTKPPAINTVLDFTGTADTGVTYAGKVIITEEGFDVDTVGGTAVQVNRNYQGTGVLTESQPADSPEVIMV